MLLKDQVCSIEQAKRLMELGVNAQSHLSWVTNQNWQKVGAIVMTELTHMPDVFKAIGANIYPAYTVAELGVMLIVDDDTHWAESNYDTHGGNWTASLTKRDVEDESGFICVHDADVEADTEAQARADMLIYLLENNLTTAQECNERLLNS